MDPRTTVLMKRTCGNCRPPVEQMLIFALKAKARTADQFRYVRRGPTHRVGSQRVVESMKRRGELAVTLSSVIAVVALLCLGALPAAAADDGPDFAKYLTVKFNEDATTHERAAARRSVDGTYEQALAAPGLQQISLPPDASPTAAAMELRADESVEFVSTPGTWKVQAFNDTFLNKQWALNNTGQVFMTQFNTATGQFVPISGTPGADVSAFDAWDAVSGLAEETIGVIDTGVAYEHPDLAPNIVDGKDFYDGDEDPRDPNGHGTHVASLAGAAADNNMGIAGADPWAKIMPLRAADEFGTFAWSAIEQAATFGIQNGVRVFNGSFGGPDDDIAFHAIIESHPEVLFVFSAGNGGADKLGDNHDVASGANKRFPCDLDLENVICVGSTDWTDKLSSFSDFGVKSVDLTAPGSSIYGARPCTVPAVDIDSQDECPYDENDPTAPVGLGGGPQAFQLLSGTSMAAPQVAAAAALVWSKCPSITSAQVKGAIVDHVDAIPSIASKIAYGGRLNLGAAVGSVATCPTPSDGTDWPTPPEQPTNPGTDNGNGGGGGGSGGGGTTITPPTIDDGPGKGLTFSVVRPSLAKIAKAKTVKFKLRCSTTCSAKYTVTPVQKGITGLKKFSGKVAKGKGTRTVTLKLPSGTLKALRALLNEGLKPKLKISLVVSDSRGATSAPTVFNIKLGR